MTMSPEMEAKSQAVAKAALAELDAMRRRRMQANAELEILDNADEDECEWWPCDECGKPYDPETASDHDSLCPECWNRDRFECKACGETFHADDRDEEFPKLYVSCGGEKHTEVMDGLNDELTEIIGSWDGEPNEISRMRKLLAYARKLSK